MSTEDEFTAGINAAAAMLDKKADDYASEHARQDGETGVWEFGRHGEDYYNTLRELADEVRDLVHGNSKNAAAVSLGSMLVPLDPPESLRGQLCGYGADLDYMDPRDRAVILQRGAERWAEILRWAGAAGVRASGGTEPA